MTAQLDAVVREAVEHVCPLPHIPEAVSVVRRRVRTVLADWNLAPDLAEDALLVISELITNAVVHALPPAALRLSRVGADGRSALRVEVTDAGPVAADGRPARRALRGRARPRARHRHRPVGRVRHAGPRGRYHTVGGAPRRVSREAPAGRDSARTTRLLRAASPVHGGGVLPDPSAVDGRSAAGDAGAGPVGVVGVVPVAAVSDHEPQLGAAGEVRSEVLRGLVDRHQPAVGDLRAVPVDLEDH